MAEGEPDNREGELLLRTLTAHYRALVAARSDATLLRQYASLLRLIKSKGHRLLDEHAAKASRAAPRSRPVPTISEEQLRNASLDDLERIVLDADTPRKDLEFIAICRFSVPHGSMRNFANREMLVGKLRSLIGNERAHEAIGAVAREQGKKI